MQSKRLLHIERTRNRKDPLDEGMAAYSVILTWRILWTEEPGGL